MTLSSLLVCMDEAAVPVLRRVLEELGIQVELCPDKVRAAVRLAQERFDLLIVDCEEKSDVVSILQECRSSASERINPGSGGGGTGEHSGDVFSRGQLRSLQAIVL